jgi:hypothetical protein
MNFINEGKRLHILIGENDGTIERSKEMSYSNYLTHYRWLSISFMIFVFLVIFIALSTPQVFATNWPMFRVTPNATLAGMTTTQLKSRIRQLQNYHSQVLQYQSRMEAIRSKYERWIKLCKDYRTRLKNIWKKKKSDYRKNPSSNRYRELRNWKAWAQSWMDYYRDSIGQYENYLTAEIEPRRMWAQSSSDAVVEEINNCRAILSSRG